MFTTRTETKIEVYKSLIAQIKVDLQNANNDKTKQMNNLTNYPLIYQTLERYCNVLKINVENGKITQETCNNVHEHVLNIRDLFAEHHSNNKQSLTVAKAQIATLKFQYDKLVKLLDFEQKVWENILSGNIDDNGVYVGKPEQRPPGTRPDDPLVDRKKIKE
tara:strand:- start:2211 stop:2696 length:486 start_codon:yes stop_codon:yes gene_type:complete